MSTLLWTWPCSAFSIDINTFAKTFLTERKVSLRGSSTPHHALLGFASSPSSLVFLLLPISACRPHRALLRPHAPHQQLVLLLASRARLPFIPSLPRAPCATSSLVTTSQHPFRPRRSRLRCRTICRLFAAAAPAIVFFRCRSSADSGCPLVHTCAVLQLLLGTPRADVRHRT